MDAFDADVLIYAAVRGHPLGAKVAALLHAAPGSPPAGASSVLLLPDVLGKPLRDSAADAAHLATVVGLGADCFITSNRRDFPAAITEIAITYPEDLPDDS